MTETPFRGDRPRVMFYVQHLLGIGHLARASRIASALADDDFDVAIVTGGLPVPGFPPPDITHIALPAIATGDKGFSGLVDIDGRPVDDDFKAARRDLLLAAYRDFAPDVLVTEAFPFGRRQVRFELLPLLDEAAASARRPLILASIRDLLQERAKPGANEDTVALIGTYFDAVMVHGDPRFARLEDSFPLQSEIADKVAYTGLVAAPPPAPATEIYDIIVSAGGGAVGSELVRAAVGASALLPKDLRWCVIAGPNLPEVDFSELSRSASANVGIFRFRKDFPSLLTGAQLSVSQAGYNTVCDVLRAGVRSLLIPFTAGGETEQTARAQRLWERGRALMLTEAELSVETMRASIEKALAAPAGDLPDLDLDGARGTGAIIRHLLEKRR
ncbi:glycosyltransferase family protein [Rhizobium sp. G21]|uniref:glycosyltransferase family protein n=1 Tax=Rhizobium sp. G21 TaxID=2758439 RepID=UPI0016022566|nr:glycosyltransferase [Rhizobium sp. G21]MBB1251163.1 glycosyl transferase [Rhizobium sp. G21]